MIEETVFPSLGGMRRVRPSRATLVVSLLDRSEQRRRPRLAGFRSVLALDFEDTSEERKCAAPGAWPDEPSDQEHALFAQGRGERVPALSDVGRIVGFLAAHRLSEERLRLLGHCHAGLGRSAAVAAWLSAAYQVPIANDPPRTTAQANARLMRLLDKAAAGGK